MITHSREETIQLAEQLARGLQKGDVLALYGDLGSGKTTFTKGIGKGLGVKDVRHINSPTFVLIKEYEARIPMYHLDLYRLDNISDIEDIAVEEYIYGDGVAIVEWAEKIKDILPEKHITVRFTIKGHEQR
ncbi:MAG: tRNA (adenosine(37)-N6)-threonylcarbamoyltransferase complex ATPase subunit type 1 TsaE [Candidatus Omnitrophica bacterium]|nr:tRNA (adenosine(37)-N6)-threonylcarbamoyltransferase complex ATPase subunit type 1 TsaE [Candidatus Omnitrophota bacterium]